MRAIPIRITAVASCAAAVLSCDVPADGSGRPAVDCARAIPPIASGFGARGAHRVEVVSLENPRWTGQRVSVHLPADLETPVPVILFAHGNELGDPAIYAALIDHIASRGYAVVFAAYAIGTPVHEDRYDALWSGFAASLVSLDDRLDRSRMGFVGHSYGAGALPLLAYRALVEEGWGANGALLYSMAPWYALGVTAEQLRSLPPHLRVLIQVFEEDSVNDHRIAIDQFHAIGVPAGSKDYVLVRSDEHGACRLSAVHTVPQSKGLRSGDDGLDHYGVFRLFDALAAYAFAGDEAGRRVALGHGSAEQVAMGSWPDGTPVAPLVWRRDPQPIRGEEAYIFKHSERESWRRLGAVGE